ncbi:AvrD family protein [Glutamicibacter mishrai]|uniref:AvrD family protein n=1 Tax=Glutamicibacter mishrai TaxID=1775880 RepID=UPI0020CD2521|nr:AvrD family protein [Glutamicibacter mishrai]UTT40448.1 AvrD family protein [Glutamicibacter mishrai]
MRRVISDPIALDSADDYLGPSESRFFGSGYRKTSPMLKAVSVRHSPDGASLLTARGSVLIGDLWSVKGSTAQRPHLGTTDVMALTLEVAEALLASRYAPNLLPSVYIRKMIITAGNEPVEDALNDFIISATTDGNSKNGVIHVITQMANMKVDVFLKQPICVPSKANLQTNDIENLIGPRTHRVYGGIYKQRTVEIRDLRVSSEQSHAAAVLKVADYSEHEPTHGIEADYQPGISLLEGFSGVLQLGQILLYEQDQLSRAESNTLWMRRTEIFVSEPPTSISADISMSADLQNSRILPLNGKRWRCATVAGQIGENLQISCDVAHELNN